MKKLPIGISNLDEIINENYIYIDKTHHVSSLATTGKYYFLSRPRRFGKSLLIDTLKQAFLGNKDLFTGLYLANNWDWHRVSPVIHLDLGLGQFQSINQFQTKIRYMLDQHFQQHKLQSNYDEIATKFSDLINQLSVKCSSKIVLLIDEYDKPIIDNITDAKLSSAMRDELRNLYSVIKTQDKNLRLVMLTGVSKFSKVSLFSGLNNLQDISLSTQYADICGYTQIELEQYFNKYLVDGNIDKVKLKSWYNGYDFGGISKQKVYNPFDILLFCSNNYNYHSYWFETATPSFLIKLLQKGNYFIPEFENYEVASSDLVSFDVDNIDLHTLLFQTGYLTIKKATMIGMLPGYILTYPNLEVKASLNGSLLKIGTSSNSSSKLLSRLNQILSSNNFDELKELFNSHFASIPNDWYRKNPMGQYEGFYASIIYSCFCALGYIVTAEDVTSIGRIDLTVKMPEKILIIEFKLAKYGSAIDAIKQIKAKKYSDKFKADSLPIYLIGMSFDEQTKSMAEILTEKV